MAEYIERQSVLAKKFNLESRLHEPISIVLASEIERVPAADVRPVVHGQWKRPKTINGRVKCFICSACGIGQVFRTSFCPNCGADMREAKT